jgi:hypothetical protein
MKMTVASMWIAVVFGLGYFAYRMAIDVAVDVDAEKQFVEWAKDLADLDPDNPVDPALYRAFHKTAPPGTRSGVSPDDVPAMDRRFGNLLATFRYSDLVVVCQRNRGKCKFTPQGLVDWKQTPKSAQGPATVDCMLAVTLECPEGVYSLKVAMRAVSDDAGRKEWQLVVNSTGLVTSAKLTDYGLRVYDILNKGAAVGNAFLRFTRSPSFQHLGYKFFVTQPYTSDSELAYFKANPQLNLFLVGGSAGFDFSTFGYEKDLFNRVFVPDLGPNASKLPEDDRKKREVEMRTQFAYIWNNGRMQIPGTMVKDNPEKSASVRMWPDRVEVRFPIELGLAGGDSPSNTARGRLVFVCADKAVVDALNAARDTADPSTAVDVKLAARPMTNMTWRLVRIESDLTPMPSAPAQGGRDVMPGMPQPPGGG